MNKILASIGLLAGCSLAGSWSDSLALAIRSHDLPSQSRLLEAPPGACGAVSGLQAAAVALAQEDAGRAPWWHPGLDGTLRRAFQDACFPSFKNAALDSTAPDAFKEALLKTMLAGAARLGPAGPSQVEAVFQSVLAKEASSTRLKAFALRNLGRSPGSSYALFAPFLNSNEAPLRAAAFDGLIQKVHANWAGGKKEENRALFASFTGQVSSPISIDQVRVLATFREDYARDYLLPRCAGHAEKIAALFSRDGNVNHIGLIMEAANLVRADENNAALQKALRQGIPDPDGIIQAALSSHPRHPKTALTLLGVFPEYAAKHAPLILDYAQGPHPELKALAQKLLPSLSAAAN